ncbi:SAR2788 family putative toxin [Weizmannia sp. FSL W8-0401]|uniref:SAR2788 family putative toxin n=1 Tax=Weizmannia sp. FSL W8-0401 TaxID=2954554 RepID=UPI0030F73CC5
MSLLPQKATFADNSINMNEINSKNIEKSLEEQGIDSSQVKVSDTANSITLKVSTDINSESAERNNIDFGENSSKDIEDSTGNSEYNNATLESDISEKNFDFTDDTSNNITEIQDDVDKATVTAELDKDTNKVTLTSKETEHGGNTLTKKYAVEIEDAYGDKIKAVFIDLDTDKKYYFDNNVAEASFAFLIPIGVEIGEVLLSHLLAASLAVTISGATYIAYSEFIKKRNKNYHYFKAYLDKKKGLFIGDGISRSKAVSRLKSHDNTWSDSKERAKSIAKSASPIGKVTAAEKDSNGKNKFYHYHPVTGYKHGKSIRLAGAHSFFGAPS